MTNCLFRTMHNSAHVMVCMCMCVRVCLCVCVRVYVCEGREGHILLKTVPYNIRLAFLNKTTISK
uniref:Uncharacterized protein n=1 Tax=Anguilla anguilla TaxID=7936 RepID=A0A0E9WL65_ANGAN